MIGIDIIEIERIKQAIERTSFVEKVFTEGEREYYNRSGRVESLAGIFAAKESIAKALGTGFRGFAINEIEVKHDALGRPFAVFHGKARELVKNRRIDISISHCGAFAIAIACFGAGSAMRQATGLASGAELGQELLEAKLENILTKELDSQLEEVLASNLVSSSGEAIQRVNLTDTTSEKRWTNRRLPLFKANDNTRSNKIQNSPTSLSNNSSELDQIYEKAMGRK